MCSSRSPQRLWREQLPGEVVGVSSLTQFHAFISSVAVFVVSHACSALLGRERRGVGVEALWCRDVYRHGLSSYWRYAGARILRTHARRETGAWPFASAARARPVSCARGSAVDRISALDKSGAGVTLAELRVEGASARVAVSVIDIPEWGFETPSER